MKSANRVFAFLIFLTTLLAEKPENYLIDVAPVITKVNTSHKVVALTFDDGPLNLTTPIILDILKKKNVKATFFVLGSRVQQFPELLAQEMADGHEIGSHTYQHPSMNEVSKNRIEEELDKTEAVISKYGPAPTLFRPPGGRYNGTLMKLARDKGYLIILWSIDTNDWRNPSVDAVVSSVINNVKPGSIILMHDGIYPAPTGQALEFIIDGLTRRGYEFVTVSELLDYYEENNGSN
jgi:polysaccharide deacetylase family sporulation protein PdaB